jgi:hypothetical protein
MDKKYYYDGTHVPDKFATLWNGYLESNIDTSYIPINSESILGDITLDICKSNFYINVYENMIYISLCSDSRYYFSDFEKHIKKVIRAIQDKFKIKIHFGEFFGTEIKHMGNQYRYTITQNEESKITVTKKTLNWENFEKK